MARVVVVDDVSDCGGAFRRWEVHVTHFDLVFC